MIILENALVWEALEKVIGQFTENNKLRSDEFSRNVLAIFRAP